MYRKGILNTIKEFIGIRPPWDGRNTGTDDEKTSGTKDIYYNRLETRIKMISEKYRATGLTVAVIRDARILWTTSLGYADKENGIAASSETAYRVASVSKTITAMLVMTLWDKKMVDLDRDIGDYLGFAVRNPNYPDKPITLEQLLIHTSSISDNGAYLEAVESGKGYPPLPDLLTPGRPAYSPKNFYKYEPGSSYNYSNFGYGIIAALVECVTGQRFSDYAREAVFVPLGLDASFLPNDISGPEKVANIYRNGSVSFSKDNALEGINRISKFPIGQLYLLAQGNLYISAVDLAKLMIVLMDGGTFEGKRILSKEAVDMMNRARPGKVFNHGSKFTGLGVDITDSLVAGRRLYGHQGRAYGATNEMFYDITDKSGVVYLSNGSKNKKAPNSFAAIGSEIINAVYEEMR